MTGKKGPGNIGAWDQAVQGVAVQVIPAMGTMFRAAVADGFTRQEAMQIVLAWLANAQQLSAQLGREKPDDPEPPRG